MQEHPTGTVTLLFTDIEGSTRLLDRLGAAYAEVLAEHRRLLREAFRAHGGVEVGTEGDAFFVAFAGAADAVAAAGAAQLALERAEVRVRIGIHTGEPLLTDEGYVGLDVHQTARICSAGHGGQVVLSRATRDLLEDRFELTSLGDHRLKDIREPVRLFQLGRETFPPLRTLHRTNLPVLPTSLVGRAAEVDRAAELLRRDDVRLLTLTGPGGTGKTRVALETAAELVDEYEDGVFFVGLAPLAEARLVLPAVAQALEVRDDLLAELRERHLLLVLDNFEQLVEAAPAVGELLAAAPALNVLATSREPLHLRGEREYAIPPLPPDHAADLFRDRAYDAEPPETVAEICRRLDYLPLAIELAAARTRSLAPPKLLERLGAQLPLLTGGPRDAPERHRTLRATIEWSYELLGEEERRLFRSLAVFAGGWTLEAAEAICDAELDTLESLVDKSLVRHLAGRYSMLETIRQYAWERLEQAGGADELPGKHARYFLDFAKAHRRAPSKASLDAVEAELDNIRRARGRLEESGEIEGELELAGALAGFFDVRGYWDEARAAAESALARADEAPAGARAAAWQALAQATYCARDLELATKAATASLDLWREADDDRGTAEALILLGLACAESGDYDRAAALTGETRELCRRLGEEVHLAGATANLGLYALIRGDTAEGRALTEEALQAFRALGHERAVGGALENLGVAELLDGRPDLAFVHLRESLEHSQAIGSPADVANALVGLAAVAAAQGAAARAARLLGAGEALRAECGAEKLAMLEARLEAKTRAESAAALGQDALEREWREGAQLTQDEAIALALEPLDSQR